MNLLEQLPDSRPMPRRISSRSAPGVGGRGRQSASAPQMAASCRGNRNQCQHRRRRWDCCGCVLSLRAGHQHKHSFLLQHSQPGWTQGHGSRRCRCPRFIGAGDQRPTNVQHDMAGRLSRPWRTDGASHSRLHHNPSGAESRCLHDARWDGGSVPRRHVDLCRDSGCQDRAP